MSIRAYDKKWGSPVVKMWSTSWSSTVSTIPRQSDPSLFKRLHELTIYAFPTLTNLWDEWSFGKCSKDHGRSGIGSVHQQIIHENSLSHKYAKNFCMESDLREEIEGTKLPEGSHPNTKIPNTKY